MAFGKGLPTAQPDLMPLQNQRNRLGLYQHARNQHYTTADEQIGNISLVN